jgi:hypothetical protein
MNSAEIYQKGRVPFMGVELIVAPGALVPRDETELLGRIALETLGAIAAPRVIDMCCGSGNLACALAHRLPGAAVWASDLTSGCVEVARRNVQLLGLSDWRGSGWQAPSTPSSATRRTSRRSAWKATARTCSTTNRARPSTAAPTVSAFTSAC